VISLAKLNKEKPNIGTEEKSPTNLIKQKLMNFKQKSPKKLFHHRFAFNLIKFFQR
jgi:hypothetical protein